MECCRYITTSIPHISSLGPQQACPFARSLLHCLSLIDCHSGPKELSSNLESLDLDASLLTHLKGIIEDIISDICATVPFILGDIDLVGKLTLEGKWMPLAGYLLLWPLLVARASSSKGSEREAWIYRRIRFIHSEIGIRYSRLFANKIKKESWDLS
jgi:hypothetical protein